jgi:hypothetical protein
MISDMLQRRKMISAKNSTRKKCIEADSKTFCKSWEEAGGNTPLLKTVVGVYY